MKWLQSNTGMAYTAKGKTITKTPLQVSDSEAEAITKMPVIASLIKNGAVTVLDKYDAPADTSVDTAKLAELTQENARLADRIRALEAAGTGDELANTKTALAEAQSKIAELENKYAALEKEAKETIADLQAELEKAKKSSKKAKAEE